MVESDGYRLDTGPSVLTMPASSSRRSPRRAPTWPTIVTLRPVDPMYRACFADGSELRVRHGPAAMTDEIRTFAGAAEAAAFRPLRHVAARALRARDAELHRPQLRLPARPRAAARGRCCAWCGWAALRKLAPTGRVVLRRSAAAAASSRSSRCTPGLSPFEALAIYCVITYMDTVEGVFFPEGGIHHVACGLAAAAEPGGAQVRATAIPSSGSCAPAGWRCRAASGSQSGERVDADVVVSNADVVGDLRRAARRPAPRVAAPRPLLAVVRAVDRGRAGRTPRRYAPTTTCTSAPTWRECVRRTAARRRPHARPVDPRERAVGRRPFARAAGRNVAVRPRARAQPRRHGRLVTRSATAIGPRS